MGSRLRGNDGVALPMPHEEMKMADNPTPVFPAKAGIQKRCQPLAFLIPYAHGFRPARERRACGFALDSRLML